MVAILVFAVTLSGCTHKATDEQSQASDRQATRLPHGASSDAAPRDVVLASSVDDHILLPILAAFLEQSGVRVKTITDSEATKSTGLAQRLRQEHAQGTVRADVFWSSEAFLTARLASEGVLAPLEAALLADWPARWIGKEGRWAGFGLRARVIVFNTALVAPGDAPEELLDLLEPKYAGRIALARPEFGTTRGHMAMILHRWGEPAYRSWLEGLARQRVILVDGNSEVVRAVASGEAIVGLTDTDDVYAGQRNGWPIDMTLALHDCRCGEPPSEDAEPGPLLIPNSVAMTASAPHPEAAHTLIAFLLSGEVEERLARSESRNTPVHPKTAEREARQAAAHDELHAVSDPGVALSETGGAADIEDAALKMSRAVELAHDILGGSR